MQQTQAQRKNIGHLRNFYHPFSQGVNPLNFPDPLRVPLAFFFIHNFNLQTM